MDTSGGSAAPPDGRRDGRDVALELQVLLLGAPGVEAFLVEVTRLAAGAVQRAQSCGVTVQRTSHSRMLAATSDEFATRMDEVQYAVDDGPCLHCLREGETVLVDDIASDGRWPSFSRRGVAVGAGSSLSVLLLVEGAPVGALNLYSRLARGLDHADQARARQFADQAAGAVALAARLAEQERREQHLETALTSRSIIDQPSGWSWPGPGWQRTKPSRSCVGARSTPT
ncbi:GAF domain-containing protein [Pseudonocardia lacus]|uniref:GAF domain-containing protein n=1 Tax=Pseudonocardia lacus TaxID=2835865 RepID=UPI002027738B|nr:GAF domain-containing protein [Pseudonocardia lacus]